MPGWSTREERGVPGKGCGPGGAAANSAPSPACQGAAWWSQLPNHQGVPGSQGSPGGSTEGAEDARGASAAQPPELSSSWVQASGVPRRVPREAAGPEGRRGRRAGRGPPLQTLTLFSQVRRQFPWKQPGAETGTRIQKCEALSSSSPSWIPAPHDPSWVLAPTLLPQSVGVQGCPTWAPPGVGVLLCPCTLQHPWAWCVGWARCGMGPVSQQGCAGAAP